MQQPLYRQHIKLCKGQNSKPPRCPAGGVQWRTHARRGGLGGRGHTHPGDRTHHTTAVVGCFHQEDHRCRSLPWMTGAVAITALCRRVRGELPSPSTIVKRWATWRVASDLQTRARGAGPRTGSREDGHARSTHAARTQPKQPTLPWYEQEKKPEAHNKNYKAKAWRTTCAGWAAHGSGAAMPQHPGAKRQRSDREVVVMLGARRTLAGEQVPWETPRQLCGEAVRINVAFRAPLSQPRGRAESAMPPPAMAVRPHRTAPEAMALFLYLPRPHDLMSHACYSAGQSRSSPLRSSPLR